MEPMLPQGTVVQLEELTLRFTRVAGELSACLPGPVQSGLGELVRSMNCYYSNLIEGHQTLPKDIDSALQDHYSEDAGRRALQEEAVAHIEVQRMIDLGQDPSDEPTSARYLKWLHKEFCSRLPEEFLKLIHPSTGKVVDVIPGEFRNEDVIIGRHVPPEASEVEGLVAYFERAYSAMRPRGVSGIYSIPAAHHRMLWIHPFIDGNGRVARLMSHAMLTRFGLGNPLWSISRGLARNVSDYKILLGEADHARHGDLDGRGNLSQLTLINFCKFFFDVCIDQVTFMRSLLKPEELARRISLFARDEIDAGRLPKGSTEILVESLHKGEIERGQIGKLTGYKERRARQILSDLIQRNLLVPTGPKKPVRLGFPLEVVGRWLPSLYY